MRILRFLAKSFGNLLIFLALLTLFTGLSINYAIDNIDVLAKATEASIPRILQENKDVFAKALLKDEDIKLEKVRELCIKKSEEVSADFCSKLNAVKTEDEMKSLLIEEMIAKTQEELTPEIQEFEKNLTEKIRNTKIKTVLGYTLPLSIAVFLIGSLFMFLAEKFKWKQALFSISLKTCIISAFTSAGSFFTKNLTPEKLENILKASPMLKGEEGSLAVKLMSALLAEWMKVVSSKIFLVSITIFTATLAVAVLTFVLKREKKPATEIIKQPEEEPEVKETKEKKKLPKAEKKQRKKMLFKK